MAVSPIELSPRHSSFNPAFILEKALHGFCNPKEKDSNESRRDGSVSSHTNIEELFPSSIDELSTDSELKLSEPEDESMEPTKITKETGDSCEILLCRSQAENSSGIVFHFTLTFVSILVGLFLSSRMSPEYSL